MDTLYDSFKNLSQIIDQKLAPALKEPVRPMTQDDIDSWKDIADRAIAEFSDLIVSAESELSSHGVVVEGDI